MPKWVHADVLENGPAYIKTNCNKVAAIISYTAGDSYATVMTAGNIVAEAAMAPGDFIFSSTPSTVPGQESNANFDGRKMTTASGKSDSAANNNGDPTHFAYVDTVNSKVLWVTTESSVQTITAGNPVTFPSLVYTTNQPT